MSNALQLRITWLPTVLAIPALLACNPSWSEAPPSARELAPEAGTPVTTQRSILLPEPTEWRGPENAPPVPGDAFVLPDSLSSVPVGPRAPVIAVWNHIVLPGESFTMTGTRFTLHEGESLGQDTSVWIWGPTTSGHQLRQANVWQVHESMLMAEVPSAFVDGMFLVWVENEAGISSPVCINRTEAEWIGPLGRTAAPGDTKRVFGKNLAYDHTEDTRGHVYIQPVSGGEFVRCTVTRVEPYALSFTVPTSVSPGAYHLWTHNGHGGVYGWSGPLPLTVAPSWQRGSNELALAPSGSDDTSAVQAAIDSLSSLTNGGTLRLAAGTFRIGRELTIKGKVAIQGMGSGTTTLLINRVWLSNNGGYHMALRNLTMKPWPGGNASVVSRTVQGGSYNQDVQIINVHMLVQNDDTSTIDIGLWAHRAEVSGCVFDALLHGDINDAWIHGNEFHGSRGNMDGAMGFAPNHEGTGNHGHIIIEHNTAFTPHWPEGPNGNRNYYDFTSEEAWRKLVWCSRLVHFSLHQDSLHHTFIARNTTRDVAIDSNKGEQILFHSSQALAYAQIATVDGRTFTIRTDGTIDGDPDFRLTKEMDEVRAAMTSVPNKISYGPTIDNSAYVMIVAGKGLGQINRVAAHTATTITVNDDWRVPPDNTSKFFLTNLYVSHIQYRNDLQGFPPGFINRHHCASNGVNYDGNTVFSVMDGNTTRRTYYADVINGYLSAPSYWCQNRNGLHRDVFVRGGTLNSRGGDWHNPPLVRVLGPLQLGNWIRRVDSDGWIGTNDIVGGWGNTPANQPLLVGCGVERCTSTEGFRVGGLDRPLVRNNRATGGTEGLGVGKFSVPVLVDNDYAGAATRYLVDAQSTFGSQLVPLQRHLTFFAGGLAPEPQVVTVANTGIVSVEWHATPSASWINVTVLAGADGLTAESLAGRLQISVDPAGLAQGSYDGTVTLTTPAGTQSIGVRMVVGQGADVVLPPAFAWFEADAFAGNHGDQIRAWAPSSGSYGGVADIDGPWTMLNTPVLARSVAELDGHAALQFPRFADGLALGHPGEHAPDGLTVVMVVKANSASGVVFGQQLYDTGNDPHKGHFLLHLAGEKGFEFRVAKGNPAGDHAGWPYLTRSVFGGPHVPSSDWHLVSAVYQPDGALSLYLGGEQAGSVGPDAGFGRIQFKNNAYGMANETRSVDGRLYAGAHADIDLAELVIFHRALSGAERAAVERHLQVKFGL